MAKPTDPIDTPLIEVGRRYRNRRTGRWCWVDTVGLVTRTVDVVQERSGRRHRYSFEDFVDMFQLETTIKRHRTAK